MTGFLKTLFGIMIFAGLFVVFCSTLVLAFAHDWLSFSAGLIGYVVLGIAAVGWKALDRK